MLVSRATVRSSMEHSISAGHLGISLNAKVDLILKTSPLHPLRCYERRDNMVVRRVLRRRSGCDGWAPAATPPVVWCLLDLQWQAGPEEMKVQHDGDERTNRHERFNIKSACL